MLDPASNRVARATSLDPGGVTGHGGDEVTIPIAQPARIRLVYANTACVLG
jgi:hypothetical protein